MFRIILFLAIFFSQLLAESDLDPVEAPILDLSSFYESSVGEYILIDAQPINVDTSTTYQWFFNSFAVPPTFGGNNSSYQIYGDTYSNGVWRVAVTNSAGTSSHEFVYQVFSDDDADGLSDYREDNITLTDSNDPDTDDDGLLDGVETNTKIYVNATDLGTDPLDADTDSDGLLDGVETSTGVYAGIDDTGTSPLLSDSDGDGIEDGKETATGLWVNFSDTGTNPNIADTDGDGMLDGIEFNDSQTSEFVNEDIDGDGNLDLDEDVDGDGKLDVAEDVDGDGNLDVAEDLDGDGKLDTYESVWFYSDWYDSINEEYQHSGDKAQLEADFMAWENLNGYYGWYEHNDTDGDGNLDLNEDVDGDGNLDVAEDVDGDGVLDLGEDLDGDGKLDTYESVWFYGEQMDWYEEEYHHSGDKTQLETDLMEWENLIGYYGWYEHNDTDGDGNLDLNEDLDGDGILDAGEDLDGDGKLDTYESVWFYSTWYDSINEEYQHSGDKAQLEADFMAWENLNGYYGWYEHNDTDGDGNLDLNEDVDGDGNLGVAEDVDGDGVLDLGEDLDGDGKLDNYESVWFYGEQMDWYGEEYQHSGDKTQLETDFNGWVMNRTGYGWYDHNDTDGDGNLDLNEDVDGDGNLDVTEDLDGDGNLDVAEDLDADGNLDVFEDANGNGVLDVVVVRSGTNPNLYDSDNDGFGDSEEVTIYGTNPNEFDTDKDGLSDSEEVTIYETDPNISDSSGDGLNDGDVVSAGFDPNTNFTDLLVFASGNEGYEAMVMERDIAIAQRDAAIVESNSKLWPAEVRDLRPGSMMIEVHQGRANLSLEIQESSDLQTWVGGDEAVIEIPLDAEETVKFFRFAMPQE